MQEDIQKFKLDSLTATSHAPQAYDRKQVRKHHTIRFASPKVGTTQWKALKYSSRSARGYVSFLFIRSPEVASGVVGSCAGTPGVAFISNAPLFQVVTVART